MLTVECFFFPDGITPNSGLTGPNTTTTIYIYIYIYYVLQKTPKTYHFYYLPINTIPHCDDFNFSNHHHHSTKFLPKTHTYLNQNKLLATIKLEGKRKSDYNNQFPPSSPTLLFHTLFLCPLPLPANRLRKYV